MRIGWNGFRVVKNPLIPSELQRFFISLSTAARDSGGYL